jgi:hypothetical protein
MIGQQFELPLPTTRIKARELGMRKYFTGKICKNGHLDIRYVENGCRSCNTVKVENHYYKNHERILGWRKNNWAQNAEIINKGRREYWSENTDEINKKRRAEYKNDIDWRRYLNWCAYWRDPAKARLNALRTHKQRSLRIPVWSESDAIKEFYDNCPIGYEVDHVIPLLGKIVSGLHVLGNLQYLTIEENRRKHNKFENT